MNFAASTPISTIASTVPSSIPVLQRHHIDFCCGGHRALGDVCDEKKLSLDAVLAEIAVAQAGPTPDHRDWTREPPSALIDYLLARYHEPTYPEFERLTALVDKVCTRHHDKAPERFTALQQTWHALVNELIPHFRKEEVVLFPMLRRLEQQGALETDGFMAAGPIQVMQMEHDDAGDALKKIRALCDDYVVPPEACMSWQALWIGLETFEAELMQHIHLESNILFKKVG